MSAAERLQPQVYAITERGQRCSACGWRTSGRLVRIGYEIPSKPEDLRDPHFKFRDLHFKFCASCVNAMYAVAARFR